MNFDWTRFRSGVLPGFGNTTPTDAFKAGDFSSLLTTNQIATDALGRPISRGRDLRSGHDAAGGRSASARSLPRQYYSGE